jgi:hypothetical protein
VDSVKELGEKALDRLVGLRTHSSYPDDQRDRAYTRSYRVSRLVVGFLGIVLPIIFIIGEMRYLRGGVHVRGSLSAYYHTSMQDLFVGGLVVIGFFLATYMAGEASSWDFRVSLVAGIAVLGVVFFPTSRSGLPVGAPPCGDASFPPGCSFVEQELGEHRTAVIHAVCAIVFIVGLAIMSLLFAVSEVIPSQSGSQTGDHVVFRSKKLFTAHLALGILILLAGLWVFAGGALHADIWELTPLYMGEVVSVWAFGASWLLAGFYLTAPARRSVTVTGGDLADHAARSQGHSQQRLDSDSEILQTR